MKRLHRDCNGCVTGRFEVLFLCHEAPQFFRDCPRSLSGRVRSTWIYGLVMFRSVTSRQFICMNQQGHVVTKVTSATLPFQKFLFFSVYCCVYTRTHVARKHVSRTSNIYPDTYYMSTDIMSPDTSCSFGILLDLGNIITVHLRHGRLVSSLCIQLQHKTTITIECHL